MLALVTGILVMYVVRIRPINRARAARGALPLRWTEIIDARARTRDLVGDRTGALTAAELEERRQREWEHHQAMSETMRWGRPVTRTYCAAHDRWCTRPWEGPHPSGGKDNARAPVDWVPYRR